MKYCVNCGKQLGASVHFCSGCGAASGHVPPPLPIPVPAAARSVASRSKRKAWLGIAALVIFALLATALFSAFQPSVDPGAVRKAQAFLSTEQHGTQVLRAVHLLGNYHHHEYVKTIANGNGAFSLVYRFHWDDDGISLVAFHCDAAGNFQDLEILQDNGGLFGIPFVGANASIWLIGNAVTAMLGDNFTEEDRRRVEGAINHADAKQLLELELTLEQTAGL